MNVGRGRVNLEQQGKSFSSGVASKFTSTGTLAPSQKTDSQQREIFQKSSLDQQSLEQANLRLFNLRGGSFSPPVPRGSANSAWGQTPQLGQNLRVFAEQQKAQMQKVNFGQSGQSEPPGTGQPKSPSFPPEFLKNWETAYSQESEQCAQLVLGALSSDDPDTKKQAVELLKKALQSKSYSCSASAGKAFSKLWDKEPELGQKIYQDLEKSPKSDIQGRLRDLSREGAKLGDLWLLGKLPAGYERAEGLEAANKKYKDTQDPKLRQQLALLNLEDTKQIERAPENLQLVKESALKGDPQALKTLVRISVNKDFADSAGRSYNKDAPVAAKLMTEVREIVQKAADQGHLATILEGFNEIGPEKLKELPQAQKAYLDFSTSSSKALAESRDPAKRSALLPYAREAALSRLPGSDQKLVDEALKEVRERAGKGDPGAQDSLDRMALTKDGSQKLDSSIREGWESGSQAVIQASNQKLWQALQSDDPRQREEAYAILKEASGSKASYTARQEAAKLLLRAAQSGNPDTQVGARAAIDGLLKGPEGKIVSYQVLGPLVADGDLWALEQAEQRPKGEMSHYDRRRGVEAARKRYAESKDPVVKEKLALLCLEFPLDAADARKHLAVARDLAHKGDSAAIKTLSRVTLSEHWNSFYLQYSRGEIFGEVMTTLRDAAAKGHKEIVLNHLLQAQQDFDKGEKTYGRAGPMSGLSLLGEMGAKLDPSDPRLGEVKECLRKGLLYSESENSRPGQKSALEGMDHMSSQLGLAEAEALARVLSKKHNHEGRDSQQVAGRVLAKALHQLSAKERSKVLSQAVEGLSKLLPANDVSSRDAALALRELQDHLPELSSTQARSLIDAYSALQPRSGNTIGDPLREAIVRMASRHQDPALKQATLQVLETNKAASADKGLNDKISDAVQARFEQKLQALLKDAVSANPQNKDAGEVQTLKSWCETMRAKQLADTKFKDDSSVDRKHIDARLQIYSKDGKIAGALARLQREALDEVARDKVNYLTSPEFRDALKLMPEEKQKAMMDSQIKILHKLSPTDGARVLQHWTNAAIEEKLPEILSTLMTKDPQGFESFLKSAIEKGGGDGLTLAEAANTLRETMEQWKKTGGRGSEAITKMLEKTPKLGPILKILTGSLSLATFAGAEGPTAELAYAKSALNLMDLSKDLKPVTSVLSRCGALGRSYGYIAKNATPITAVFGAAIDGIDANKAAEDGDINKAGGKIVSSVGGCLVAGGAVTTGTVLGAPVGLVMMGTGVVLIAGGTIWAAVFGDDDDKSWMRKKGFLWK